MYINTLRYLTILLIAIATCTTCAAAELSLLFMGDNGHHQPARRFQELAPALAKRGISLQYTDRMPDLNPETLRQYDGLVLYANIDRIDQEQADAVLEFVAGGKGFVPLHCATYCWRNNAAMVALMGAQFQRHGARVFATEVTSDHPVVEGFDGFQSWDETYIHHLHNEENRTVVEYRREGEQAEGNSREPWTWVRTHGKGRVFYTAWGHDQRTFTQPGFHNLVERGIRWACGGDPRKAGKFVNTERFSAPEMNPPASGLAKFDYVDVGPKIPNYTPSRSWGTQGAPKTLMQKPLLAEESRKHFVTPRGFAVESYADETNFDAKPIAMTWDERGRLWICETVDYPNELGGDRDRIRICEDTDGDAVADKFTVFAEGLSIPTAIVIVRGGAVVQNGTETIYLKDTDGDDIADVNKTLITGWGLGDTHGGVSNFRYGLDNWIWAMQGYNYSTPVYEGKKTQSFRQGFWRFKLSNDEPLRVVDLEFMRASDNNTWGLGISEEGLIFGSTANHNPSMFMTIPNRYYERVRGWAAPTLRSIADSHRFDPITENVRQVDHHGGYTAGAGHSLYTARAFPRDWWNKTAFVCGPTGHLVGTFVLRRDGANYTSSSPLNLLASDDEWSAPIMAEVGPDGAVWVIDWYNYIVQHNPTPNGFKTGKGAAYESDLRDKRRGRIYRVVPSGDTPAQSSLHAFSDLSKAESKDLVATLKHPSMRWRLHAQRLLIERSKQLGQEIKQQLWQLVGDSSVDAIGLNVGAIHALHTLAALNSISSDAVAASLSHESAGVRLNALRVLPRDEDGLAVLLENRSIFADEDAQVRLQAVLTLGDMPNSPSAGQLIAKLCTDEQDRVIQDALTSAAAGHSASFLKSLAAAEKQTATSSAIARRVSEHIGRGRPSAEVLSGIVGDLAGGNSQLTAVILEGILEGLPKDFGATSTALDAAFLKSFEQLQSDSKIKVLRLAAACGTDALDSKSAQIVESIIDVLVDEDANEPKRIAAARDLIGFRPNDSDAVEEIIDCISPQTSPEFADGLLLTLRECISDEAGDVLLDSMESWSPRTKATAIGLLLSKPQWIASLLAAVDRREFDLDELSLDQKQALRSAPDPALQAKAEELLARGGGLPDADREKVLQSLMYVTKNRGDTENGKAVFVKVCAACHQYGKLGQKIGPNLTGMAVHPKEELLTHILDPSRNVEGNYRMYNVLTADGVVVNGMLAGESKTTITIVNAQAKEISIPREEIDQFVASRKSVMPEGFEKQITPDELTDLLEFLTDTGPYVPLPLDEVATAVSTKGLFHNGDDGPDRMVFKDWEPKVFDGIPFVLTDPKGKSTNNIILLNGPNGSLPPKMPKSVAMPCGTAAKAIHMLSGVGGWNHPFDSRKTTSMIVRLLYADGTSETHELKNAIHFADYIRRVEVPGSEFAFALGNQQIRYLKISPRNEGVIDTIELVKGPDNSAPMVMAVTIETR